MLMANTIRFRAHFVGVLALLGGCGTVSSGADLRAADTLRGRDLYQTFCGACHTAQMHWRDQRLVKSWDDLRYQVDRWQKYAGQNWSKDDIDDVASYLNRVFYGIPCPLAGCGGPRARLNDAPGLARVQ
jgi:mono/diheme cytochrome c family protein